MKKKGAMLKLIVSEMKEDDLEEVVKIERVSFPSPWPKEQFLMDMRDSGYSYLYVVREGKGKILGYFAYWLMGKEIHLTNLAVHPKFRRRKIAKWILKWVIEKAKKEDSSIITLEVRSSNILAQKLYQKFNFIPIAIRKNYYGDTKEDAIVMMYNL